MKCKIRTLGIVEEAVERCNDWMTHEIDEAKVITIIVEHCVHSDGSQSCQGTNHSQRQDGSRSKGD